MPTIERVRTEILPDAANPQLLVHITDNEGTTGIGETWLGHYRPNLDPGAPVVPYQAVIDAVLGPMLRGLAISSTADIAAAWDTLIRATYQYGDDGIVRDALSGIDLALWDLIGRREGVPVTSMLGPRLHDRIPVYASLTWHGQADRIIADIAAAAVAGFSAAKLHESDPLLIRTVRSEVDPAFSLMADVSAAYDEAGSLALVAGLEDLALDWIEEPLYPQRDRAALARIRSSSSTPIAGGENELSLAGINTLVDAGAVDLVQPEIAKVGGLTEARRIGAAISSSGLPLAPHNFSLGPSLHASWHWAAAQPATRWLEIPWLPAGQGFPGLGDLPVVDGGTIGLPPGPGLGFPHE